MPKMWGYIKLKLHWRAKMCIRDSLYEDYAEGLLDEAEYSFAKKSYDEQYADPVSYTHLYCYLDGKTVVKISFSKTDTTLEDCLEHYLRGL